MSEKAERDYEEAVQGSCHLQPLPLSTTIPLTFVGRKLTSGFRFASTSTFDKKLTMFQENFKNIPSLRGIFPKIVIFSKFTENFPKILSQFLHKIHFSQTSLISIFSSVEVLLRLLDHALPLKKNFRPKIEDVSSYLNILPFLDRGIQNRTFVLRFIGAND